MPAPADRTLVVDVPATTANLGAGFDVLALALAWTARFEVVPGGRGLRVVPPAGAPASWADPAQNLVTRAFTRGWAAAGGLGP
ncbi:MAG TPA: homoserine kinase, partial [Candidatus Dormibacteraeota bacterium]|nr:homoserine kinase [Candidatus Dormibacteraeota bacterium]